MDTSGTARFPLAAAVPLTPLPVAAKPPAVGLRVFAITKSSTPPIRLKTPMSTSVLTYLSAKTPMNNGEMIEPAKA